MIDEKLMQLRLEEQGDGPEKKQAAKYSAISAFSRQKNSK